MDNIKLISYTINKKQSTSHKPPPPPKKEKTKRIITTHKKWNFTEMELSQEKQKEYIQELYDNLLSKKDADTESGTEETKMILRQMNQKIYGYKCQDIQKGIYDETEFIDILTIVEKIIACESLCYYCKKPFSILYEYVREPMQWTVERIDNAYGHNKTNVEIACLSCNLHRRTMYHERYSFTKQLVIEKI